MTLDMFQQEISLSHGLVLVNAVAIVELHGSNKNMIQLQEVDIIVHTRAQSVSPPIVSNGTVFSLQGTDGSAHCKQICAQKRWHPPSCQS
jgi:hypothetical protein